MSVFAENNDLMKIHNTSDLLDKMEVPVGGVVKFSASDGSKTVNLDMTRDNGSFLDSDTPANEHDFENSKWTITLTYGESIATITLIKHGNGNGNGKGQDEYWLDSYNVTKPGTPADPGDGGEDSEEAGSIIIKKEVVTSDGVIVPEDKVYTFTVIAENNKAFKPVTVNVKQGGSEEIKEVPVGAYTITEDTAAAAIDDYNLTVKMREQDPVKNCESITVTVTKDTPVKVTATNTYAKKDEGTPEPKNGQIKIVKQVVDEEENVITLKDEKEFKFDIKSTDLEDSLEGVSVRVGGTQHGEAYVYRLKEGEYTIAEADHSAEIDGYTFKEVKFYDEAGKEIPVTGNEQSFAKVTTSSEEETVVIVKNIYTKNNEEPQQPEEKGQIKITKKVADANGNPVTLLKDKIFAFQLKKGDSELYAYVLVKTDTSEATIEFDVEPGEYSLEEYSDWLEIDGYTFKQVEMPKSVTVKAGTLAEITATNTYTKKDDSTTTLPDPDVPQGSGPENPEEPDEPIIDEPDVPLAPGPDEPIINDPDVPLGPAPVIEDPDAPLTSTSSEEADPNQPKTGDEAPLALMMGMFLVSVGALGTIVVRRKETEK